MDPPSGNAGHRTAPRLPRGGLYIHWPFCDTKCGYCDFYSLPHRDAPVTPVVDAVIRELIHRLAEPACTVDTIFFGGGTPTTLATPELTRILQTVRRQCTDQPVKEFTVEANPATVDQAKAEALCANGVNRVSIGAQSFHPDELAALERIHDPADVPVAVRTFRQAGIDNLNIDLIFGMTGQTLDTWHTSLRRAIDLSPHHCACYGLTYEPGTALTKQLHQGRVKPCDEGLEADLYACAVDTLTGAGYHQYEISNFARPGFECRHNLGYWHNEPFIGVGPSAAGYLDGRRYKNIAHIDQYVRRVNATGHAEVDTEVLTGTAAAIETLMMQMRLVTGIDLADFRRRHDVDLAAACQRTIADLAARGLLECTRASLRLTRSGQLFADGIITELAAGIDVGPRLSLPVLQSGISAPKPSSGGPP